MKLAEALVRIKDLKGKSAELQRVTYEDATFDIVDEDIEVPSIEESLTTLVTVSRETASLKSRIARTNATHGLTDKLHEMEHLRSLVSKLEPLTRNKQIVVNLRHINYNDTATKIPTHATYDVEAWTKKLNEYRDKIRQIDLDLQRLNWEVDLVD
ncbi:hypothetical protein LCGC14_1518470 [marine sediment metagenome]|uniref:Septicolysin n=1 Tax=marine sediment metagenome TaxID=412755 RepID=A0A0F9LEX6_9ZZZZ